MMSIFAIDTNCLHYISLQFHAIPVLASFLLGPAFISGLAAQINYAMKIGAKAEALCMVALKISLEAKIEICNSR